MQDIIFPRRLSSSGCRFGSVTANRRNQLKLFPNVRSRVRSYFRLNGGHSYRTERLKNEAARLDVQVCGSELEALLVRRGSGAELFDLPAYQEVLFLFQADLALLGEFQAGHEGACPSRTPLQLGFRPVLNIPALLRQQLIERAPV